MNVHAGPPAKLPDTNFSSSRRLVGMRSESYAHGYAWGIGGPVCIHFTGHGCCAGVLRHTEGWARAAMQRSAAGTEPVQEQASLPCSHCAQHSAAHATLHRARIELEER